MAYDNSINIGAPPLLWSNVYEAFQQINENFTIIGTSISRTVPFNIAHVELSNPVRVVIVSTESSVSTGDRIFIQNTGISQLDNNTYYVTKISDNEFELYTDADRTTSVDGAGYDAYSSGGGEIQGLTSLTDLNFEEFNSNLIPLTTAEFTLGATNNRWKELHVSEFINDVGETNGIWLGLAQIKGIGSTVDLPANSTVNGSLIIDPNKTFFKAVEVDNGNSVVANEFSDTINFISGDSIRLTVDSAAEQITIDNTGVTSNVGGTGINVSSAKGDVTITNTGVTELSNTTTIVDARATGSGIAVSSTTGNVTITNTGILDVASGFGINATNSDGQVSLNVNTSVIPTSAFTRVHIDGDLVVNDLIADGISDAINFIQGYGISLSNNAGTDTMTIAVDQNLDISGSVFGDDSTKLVDAVESKIVGNIDTNLIETAIITSQGGNLNTSGQTLIIGAANGTDFGGILVIGGGTGTNGLGGGVGIAGGTGSNGVGGNVSVSGGTGSTDGAGASLSGGTGSGGDGGLVTVAGGTGSAGNGGGVTIVGGSGSVTDGIINIGTLNTSAVNIANAVIAGDLTGSVFADDSTLLVDAVDGRFNGNLTGDVTGDVTGSVFADDSTMLIDGVDGKIVGPVESTRIVGNFIGSVFADDSTQIIDGDNGTVVYSATTPSDWNGAPPTSIGEAIDRLATLVKTLNGGTGA